MRFFLALCGVLFLHGLFAQSPLQIDIPKGPTPWSSLQFNQGADQFQFAIVTDRTGGIRPGVFDTAVDKLNLLQPEFVMSVGDLIMGYTEDTIELNRQWAEFNAMIGRLQMPFFYLPGNHDITNKTMEAMWKRRFGPTYYHFVYKDVLFLCLNSEDMIRGAGWGSIGDTQYEYIKKTLADNADVRWTLVFLHQPLWEQNNPERWPDVEELLRDRPHHVFAGHVHHYVKYLRNNGRYYTLGTTGGGSRLRGPRLGEFDHVSWVTMTDGGPIIANLALDGIYSDSVTTEADYDFISRVYDSKPIRFSPVTFPEKKFRGGNINMKFFNETDLPMQIEVDPGFSFDYTVELPKDTVRVPPNSARTYRWRLEARQTRAYDKLSPQPLNINLIFDYEGQELKLPFRYLISPTPRSSLQETGRVKIDGKLRDWDELPYQLSPPTDSSCSVAWGMRYDTEWLYLAAAVQDDAVVTGDGESIREQDFIRFVLNADPLEASLIDAGEQGYRHSLVRSFAPESGNIPSVRLAGGDRELEIPYACRTTDDGYVLEAAIPLAYLNDRQGNPWRHLRINWCVQDADPGNGRLPRYWWQPEWNGAENVVGSGLFYRDQPE
jgi:hypothetical protein